jgi:uncharacterized repeat protein (TIGR03803 family)
MNLTATVFPLGLSKLESHRLARAALGVLLLGSAVPVVTAATLTPLYSFTNGIDGTYPSAGLVQGSDGDFYGTTDNGGTNGDGGIFKITCGGALTPLYSFTNGVDGALVAGPRPRLFQGRDGNFYGTTFYGGTHVDGNIFSLNSNGALTVLYSFTNGMDGACPCAGVVQGSDSNFYGTTCGTDGRGPDPSWGSIFKISPGGVLTPLYAFTNGVDGATPTAALVQAADGNFYGTADNGGTNGDGTVFRITSDGVLTPLYSFTNGVDGAIPTAGLVQASDGNFYGTTYGGGTKNVGSVFRITSGGVLTALYSFTNGVDCAGPFAGLIQGSDGNFYGITRYGGRKEAGGIFKITPGGILTPLYTFTNGLDGERPYGGLVQGSNGNLYGTTEFGGVSGSGAGTFFQLSLADSPIIATLPAPLLTNITTAQLTNSLTPGSNSAKASSESGLATADSQSTGSSNLAATAPTTNLTVSSVTSNTAAPDRLDATHNAGGASSVTAKVATPTAPPQPGSLQVASVSAQLTNSLNSASNSAKASSESGLATADGQSTGSSNLAATAPMTNLTVSSVTPNTTAPDRLDATHSAGGASSVTAKIAAPTAPPRPGSLQVASVSGTEGAGLRLRASASLSAAVLAVMREGSKVTLLGDSQISDGFRWRDVQYGNLKGWAASEYLVFGVAAK